MLLIPTKLQDSDLEFKIWQLLARVAASDLEFRLRRLPARVALDSHRWCLGWGLLSHLPRAHCSATSSQPMRWACLAKSQQLPCSSNPKAHCLDKLKSHPARVVQCSDKLPIKVRGCSGPSLKEAWARQLQAFSEPVPYLKATLSLVKRSHRNHCCRQHQVSSSLEKQLTISSNLMGSSISELNNTRCALEN